MKCFLFMFMFAETGRNNVVIIYKWPQPQSDSINLNSILALRDHKIPSFHPRLLLSIAFFYKAASVYSLNPQVCNCIAT